MLCQLVCVDRRYQRMNCFNIREVQSILKKKFFTDLINSKDQHLFFNNSAIGIRFKTNNLNLINTNNQLNYFFGLEYMPKIRLVNLSFLTTLTTPHNTLNDNQTTIFFNNNSFFFPLINFFSNNSKIINIINQII